MTPDTIRSLRQSLGLTQEALARKLGVSWNTVARWESGLHAPDKYNDMLLKRMQRKIAKES